MRILYDSKQSKFKTPFGTLKPDQECTLSIYIPGTVETASVQCCLRCEDNFPAWDVPMHFTMRKGAYEIFEGKFSVAAPGLFFYFFRIFKKDGSSFRLFKQGNDTNMEEGGMWQLSCIPDDFTVPQWAQGSTIYQVFPDRFHRSGRCDLTGKLRPYTLHKEWYEEVDWKPNAEGEVLNNDFYGGNFQGITDKMSYIASLGVNMLYLNPISKSFSNHRYDTGDYKTPDPMLGTEKDFVNMCNAAHANGIKVILDGVYSHTGSNSLYFDRERTFGGNGAFCRQDSPFRSWYTFHNWPWSYNSWWGFDTLPTVNKMDPGFVKYIITDEDSVLAHWLKLGCDGFRLDVADELPDEFIKMIHDRIRQINPEALLIGEVWEDASCKIAYGKRRTYFTRGELDSIMNYPFRTAIINFMRGWDGGAGLRETVMNIAENYPSDVLNCCMNLLGTHDTPRILTALVDDFDGTREEKAQRHLSRHQMEVARERLLMASFLQFTLPGSPSIYYGDEASMEGYKDPFNRRPFPWGREDRELQDHYSRLGRLRKDQAALRLGNIEFFQAGDKHLGFTRSYKGQTLKVFCNRSGDSWEIPAGQVILGYNLQTVAPGWLVLGPRGFCVTEG